MPGVGVEPTTALADNILSVARIPVPPPGHSIAEYLYDCARSLFYQKLRFLFRKKCQLISGVFPNGCTPLGGRSVLTVGTQISSVRTAVCDLMPNWSWVITLRFI